MRRLYGVGIVATMAACAIGVGDEAGGAVGRVPAPSNIGEDDDTDDNSNDDDDDDDDSVSSGTDPADATTGVTTQPGMTSGPIDDDGASTWVDASSGSDGSEGPGIPATTGPPADEQPDSGWWSPCDVDADCGGDGLVCSGGGTCTGYCDGGDPETCGPSPGGTAVPVCVTSSEDKCALDCSGGRTCPTPMTCRSFNSGTLEACA